MHHYEMKKTTEYVGKAIKTDRRLLQFKLIPFPSEGLYYQLVGFFIVSTGLQTQVDEFVTSVEPSMNRTC